MGRKGLLIKQFLNNAFVTTTIVLIVLSVVALWYDGTMICISTIFETLLLSAVCEVIKKVGFTALYERIRNASFPSSYSPESLLQANKNIAVIHLNHRNVSIQPSQCFV